jgi:uncharacterized protein YkwD
MAPTMKLKYAFPLFIIFLSTSCAKDDILISEDIFVHDEISIEYLEPTASEKQLFELINKHRAEKNLSPLSFDSYVYSQAEKHNKFMISIGAKSHGNFEKRAENIAKKLKVVAIAENLARNYTSNEEMLEAWIDSSGHKKNLEGDFTHSAISIKQDSDGILYATQIFYK